MGYTDQLRELFPEATSIAIKGAIPDAKYLELIGTMGEMYDKIAAKGFVFPEELKRRDPREPHRTIKEAFEDKIEKIIKRLFKRQKERVLSYVEVNPPRWNIMDTPPELGNDVYEDEGTETALVLLFVAIALDANDIFVSESDIPLDGYSQNALIAARVAVGDLIRGINETTRDLVQQAIALFVETPGMTIGELAKLLPFPEYRARLIAITEVSNIYGEMTLRNAELLMAEFPGMIVVRTWFTNNDPNVCKICRGLDGKEAIGIKPFISSFDGGKYYKQGDPHPGCRCWTSVSVRAKE